MAPIHHTAPTESPHDDMPDHACAETKPDTKPEAEKSRRKKKPPCEIRELRFQIGRLRRQIDRRVRSTEREARRLTSWKTYAKYFPSSAIGLAFGLGLALAAGLSGRRVMRMTAGSILRRSSKGLSENLVAQFGQIWAESAPRGKESRHG